MGALEVLRERKIDPPADAHYAPASGQGYTLLEKYLCGFLNSVGGRILFGVDDASEVEMVPLIAASSATASAAEGPGHINEMQNGMVNEAKDAVRKLVDATALRLSPQVDSSLYDVAFIPVVSRDASVSEHSIVDDTATAQLLLSPAKLQCCFVIEVTVQQPRDRGRACYFPDEYSWCTWQRKTTSTMIQTEQWARAHLTSQNCGWRTIENGYPGASTPTIDQTMFLGEKAEHFTGRQWFYDHIHKLLSEQQKQPRVAAGNSQATAGAIAQSGGSYSRGLAVHAGEGYGKTALMGNLLRFGGRDNRFVCSKGKRLCVLGYHCCQAGDPRTLNSTEFIRSLAVQLAVGYKVPRSSGKQTKVSRHSTGGEGENDLRIRRRLESKAVGQYYSTVLREQPAVRAALAGENPEIALEEGILAPLRSYCSPSHSSTTAPDVPCVIVIDSIDEGAPQRQRQRCRQKSVEAPSALCSTPSSPLLRQQGMGRWQGDKHVYRPEANDFPPLGTAASPTEVNSCKHFLKSQHQLLQSRAWLLKIQQHIRDRLGDKFTHACVPGDAFTDSYDHSRALIASTPERQGSVISAAAGHSTDRTRR